MVSQLSMGFVGWLQQSDVEKLGLVVRFMDEDSHISRKNALTEYCLTWYPGLRTPVRDFLP